MLDLIIASKPCTCSLLSGVSTNALQLIALDRALSFITYTFGSNLHVGELTWINDDNGSIVCIMLSFEMSSYLMSHWKKSLSYKNHHLHVRIL